MRYLAELLIALVCVACGGHTVASDPQPASKPDPSGTSAGTGSTKPKPTPGTAGTGGTSMSVPQPDPEPNPQPECTGPQPMCVPNCTSKDRMVSDCVGDQYVCGMGWIDLDSCPKDACARSSPNCCAANGQSEFPECGADGLIGDCPAGSEPKATCLPAGLGITDCAELQDGRACASPDLVCLRDVCGLNCRCDPDESGALHWQCFVNVC